MVSPVCAPTAARKAGILCTASTTNANFAAEITVSKRRVTARMDAVQMAVTGVTTGHSVRQDVHRIAKTVHAILIRGTVTTDAGPAHTGIIVLVPVYPPVETRAVMRCLGGASVRTI